MRMRQRSVRSVALALAADRHSAASPHAQGGAHSRPTSRRRLPAAPGARRERRGARPSRSRTRPTPSAPRPSRATTRRSGAVCATRARRPARQQPARSARRACWSRRSRSTRARSFTTAGEAWRQIRNWLDHSLSAASSSCSSFWRSRCTTVARARSAGTDADTGRLIERFTYFERTVALDRRRSPSSSSRFRALVMAFGKFFLLPLIGGQLFGWLTYALKTAAQLRRPAVRGVAGRHVPHLPARQLADAAPTWAWLQGAGGMLGGEHPPSGRFNAGEKMVFWGGVVVLGAVVVGFGLRARQARARARPDAAAHAGRAHVARDRARS